jgi:hypothetical protein
VRRVNQTTSAFEVSQCFSAQCDMVRSCCRNGDVGQSKSQQAVRAQAFRFSCGRLGIKGFASQELCARQAHDEPN